LELEDAAPAAVFKELADEPDEGGEKTGERQQSADRVDDIARAPAITPWLHKLRPDGPFEGLVRASIFRMDMGEEIEIGIAGDFRVDRYELRKLWIVAVDVVLIGEQRRVVFDDGGEGGAQAQQFDELLLRGREFPVADRGGRGRGRGGRGRPCLRGGKGCKQEHWCSDGVKSPGQYLTMTAHFDFPSRKEAFVPLLHIQRMRRAVG